MSEPVIAAAGQPVTGSVAAPHDSPSGPADRVAAQVSDRPEIAIGGAFAGGLLAALVLKRLVR